MKNALCMTHVSGSFLYWCEKHFNPKRTKDKACIFREIFLYPFVNIEEKKESTFFKKKTDYTDVLYCSEKNGFSHLWSVNGLSYVVMACVSGPFLYQNKQHFNPKINFTISWKTEHMFSGKFFCIHTSTLKKETISFFKKKTDYMDVLYYGEKNRFSYLWFVNGLSCVVHVMLVLILSKVMEQ